MSAGIRAGVSSDAYLQVDGADALKIEANGNLTTSGKISSTPFGPMMSAYLNTSTALPDAVYTEVPFNATVAATGSTFNTTTGRWTPGVVGWYQLNSTVTISPTVGDAISNLQINIYKNGTSYRRGTILTGISGILSTSALSVSALVNASTITDYFSIWIYCDITSGTASLVNGSTISTFDGYFVRSAA